VRDVLAIQDLLRAFVAAEEHRERTAGQVYNIGGGHDNAVSVLELIHLIDSALHLQLRYRSRPQLPGDQAAYITNFDKFTKHTKWLPERGVEQTVHDIYRWYKDNEPLFVPSRLPVPPSPLLNAEIREIAS
jgi:CDP-paratose 2-epimerase